MKVLSKITYLQHYGEVPEYLQQRNEEERRAQEEYEHFLKEQRKQGAMKQLSAEERRDVLEVPERSNSFPKTAEDHTPGGKLKNTFIQSHKVRINKRSRCSSANGSSMIACMWFSPRRA